MSLDQSLAAAAGKLTGAPMMVETFEKIGVGQWFRLATGIIEVVAAILLLVPGFAAFGALLLSCTMVGATLAHLTVLGGSPVPPIVLLALCLVVLYLRRDQILARLGR